MKHIFNENSYRKACVVVYNHVTEVLIFYAKTYGDGPVRKIRVYLISRFSSIRENVMLAKYTWFTVLPPMHQSINLNSKCTWYYSNK